METFLRSWYLVVAALVAGCSGSDPEDKYARTTRCEVVTGLIAAFHPSLPSGERQELGEINRRYSQQALGAAAELKKTFAEVEADKRALLVELQGKLNAASNDDYANSLVVEAKSCGQTLD